jgi:glycogen debranching enzyme
MLPSAQTKSAIATREKAERQAAPASHVIEAMPEVPFYIPTSGPTARPRRTLKHGDSFLVLDAHGDIGVSAEGSDGLFSRDTRFLSRFEVRINDVAPLLLGSNVRHDSAVLNVDLTNPDIYADGRIIIEKDLLHIDRTVVIWQDTVYQRLAIRNYGPKPIRLTLSFGFDSDFADIFEVRGLRRARRGRGTRTLNPPHQAVLNYVGLDDAARRTVLHFEPVPTELTETTAAYTLTLAPNEAMSIVVTIRCNPQEIMPVPFLRGLLRAHRALRSAGVGAASVETSHAVFNEVLCRSWADLSMLMTATPQGLYPYAGIPWYSTTFGRDGIITALQTLWLDPRIARGVLSRLAHFQARATDPASDAEPGKIVHEMRAGEMAALGEVPFRLYYGTVDATPLFVVLAGLYVERTADYATLHALWPAIEAALAWIDGPGDRDHDGFVEYFRATETGLANQGWKDSFDAVFHADGRLAEGPIALAEVQGYVFAAKRLAARCAAYLGHHDRARELDRQAEQLAERFDAAFWCPELGMYALALDGNKQPCRVSTSNAGQVLFTGIAKPERAREIGARLIGPDFFSGWGVRTVSRREPRYNPMSYHNGSVWPHDNALVALGLGRCGMKGAVERIFTGLFDTATYMDLRRLPELFCGFQRTPNRGPTLYPVACSPQAWAAPVFFTLLESLLGLEIDPIARAIRFRDPQLPSFIEQVILRNLSVKDASVDLAIHRHAGDVSLRILKIEGNVGVSVVY